MQYNQDMTWANQAKLRKGNLTLSPSLFSFQNLKQLNSITLENFYQVLPEF